MWNSFKRTATLQQLRQNIVCTTLEKVEWFLL